MANGGSIKYSIGFNVDKAGLNQIKSSLQEIKQMTAGDLMRINSTSIQTAEKDLKELQSSIAAIDNALDRAFNTDLGTLNITKFNQQLKNLDLNRIYAGFSKAGAAGQAAFRNTTAQILTTNMQLKQSHKLIDSMATTMANTIKWGAASAVMNKFTGSVQQAYGYVKSLDGSLNDIRIVTEKSSDEMAKFAVEANKAAKALGKTTTDYTDAALIYYQQGLSEEEVKARAETTLKAANVTGQAGAEVSEQLTAVWNGYKVSAEEAELYVDKLAAVAATTAADLEELSVGMSKVASAANTMGVDVDQLNAQLATIVSVTRQAPESVGTALKTIYARMGDIEAGLDTETTLGNYTEIMAQMGFNVLDANGKLRDMGEVVEEIGSKWESLSREQQVALSQTVAGTRQYNNLLALFDNWDMYTEAMETSKNSAGTLQEQQDIYMESTAAHLNQLKAASEDLYDSLLNEKGINSVVDGLTVATDVMANFVDAIGGGGNTLLLLGSIATQVFSRHIASGIATTIRNFQAAKENANQLAAEMEILNKYENANINDARTQNLIQMKRQVLDLDKAITNEERNIANEYINQQNELYKNQDLLNQQLQLAQESYQRHTGENASNLSNDVLAEQLKKQGTELIEQAEQLKKSDEAFRNIKTSVDAYISAMERANNVDEARKHALDTIEDNQEGLVNVIEQAREQTNLSKENQKELNAALQEWYNLTKGGTKINLADIRTVEAGINVRKVLEKVLRQEGKALQLEGTYAKEYQQKMDNVNRTINESSTVFKNFIHSIDVRNTIQQMVTLTSKIGQLASGINSLSRIGKIWDDDSLETGEKFLQIISAGSIGLTMLSSGLFGALDIYKKLSASLQQFIVMTQLQNNLALKTIGIEKARSVQEALYLVLKQRGIAITNKELKTLTARQAIDKIHAAYQAGEITYYQRQIALSQIKNIVKEKENATLLKSLKIKKLLTPTTILWTAALIGAVLVINKLVKEHNADADAAKAAAEEVTKLTERYNKLRESVENFKDSVSDYSDAIDSLKDLDKQTKEYGETVDEINEKAKALIETYGLYDKFETKDGILQVKEGVDLEALIKEREAAADAMQQSMYAANITSSEANLKNRATLLERAFGNKINQTYDTRYADRVESAELQEAARRLLAVENYQSFSADAVAELFENDFKGIAARLDESLKDQLFDLTEAMKKASAATDYWSEQMLAVDVEELFGSDFTEKFGKTKSDQMVSIIANQGADKTFIQNLNNLEGPELGKAIQARRITYANDKEGLIKEYASKILGYDETQLSRAVIDTGLWKGNLTVDGKKMSEKKVSYEDMYEALARQELQQNIISEQASGQEEFKKILEETVGNAEEFGEQYGTDFSMSLLNAMSTGDISNFSLANIFADLSPQEIEKLKTVDFAAVLGLTPEELTTLGFGSAEAFNDAWSAALEQYEITPFVEKIQKNIDQVSGAIDTLYKGDELDEEELAELEKKYTELADIRDKTSNEYLNKLEEIKQAEEDTLKESSLLDFKDALNDIGDLENTDLDKLDFDELKTLKDNLQEIFDKEYVLDWSITNDIVSDTQALIHEADRLQVAFEALGDGFKVSADKSKDLFNVFPELAENAQVLADGSVQLNQDVVNKVLQGQQDIIAGDKEKTIENINNRITELDAEIKVWEDKLTTVQSGALSEAEMEDELADTKKKLEEEVADFEKTAQEVQLQNDEIVTENIVDAWSIRENAAINYATSATEALSGKVPVKRVYKDISPSTDNKGLSTVKDLSTSEFSQAGEEIKALLEAEIKKILESKVEQRAALVSYLSELQYELGPGMDAAKAANAAKDLVDALEDELDIYHDINIELTKLETSLGKLEKQEEKLFGQDLVNNLNKQLDILDNQKDAYREKIALAQMEAAILRTSLSSQGVAFGADGTITNYNAMLQAKMDAVNALNEQYNQMSEDEQKAFKNTLEAAEKEYEKFKEDMERYEEVVHNEIPEMQEAIQEIIDREIEINIQKLNMEVELRLDLTEAQKDWDEFQRKVIDDLDDEDIYENAMADKDLYKTLLSNGVIGAGTDVINTTLDELAKMNAGETSDIYGDNKVAALENLEEQMTNLMDHLENLADLEEEIHQAYLDMVDKVGEAFDEQIENFEYVNDLIDHNLKVVQLLKGDDAYADMALFYEQQAANNLDILRSQREAADYYKMMMETETDPEAIEKWTELWKDAVNGLNSAVEDAIENIIDKYTNTINTIFDELNDKLTNGLGLDYLTQAWELQNENADAYLDTVNSAFELQQLEAKYLQSIDESDSAKAQDQLNELMEDELKKLREKDKLTQYDIDRANAMYELKLKEIALEEAQQNKTQMRLRRDSSGNYSYQFVADADSIAEAQREVDEARNSLYNMDRDEYRENQEAILEIYTEYQEKMRDAANMSAEERALIEQEYNERINNLIAENGVLRANLSQSAMMALADAEEAILMNEIIPQWDGGLQQMIDKIAGEGGLGPACEEAMNALDEATQNYNDDLAEIEETAGVSFDALADGQDTNIDLAETLAERQAENIELTIEEMDAVRGLVEAVEELRNAYDDVYASATQALGAAQELREAQYGSSVDDGGSSGSGSSSNGSGSGSSSSGGGSGSSSSGSGSGGGGSAAAAGSDMIKGLATAIWCHSNDGWGDSKSARTANLDQKIGAGTGSSVQALINKEGPSGGLYDYWVRVLNKDASRYFYSQFKTGGYTGAWGSEGKFAMLHEKELVLNQADTSNILTAVKTVRSIAPILEAIDSSISSRIAGIKPGLGGMIEASSSGINQNVQIEAHFPMATDRFEIEAAFNSLVNQATQHAFNTRR